MLLLHGIDIVEVEEIERLLRDVDEHFLKRCFRETELRSFDNSPREAEHYAGVFAAKEATLKALGTGFGTGVGFADVEIQQLPTGQPVVILHGNAAVHAKRRGIISWSVSISHSARQAVASVIAVATPV